MWKRDSTVTMATTDDADRAHCTTRARAQRAITAGSGVECAARRGRVVKARGAEHSSVARGCGSAPAVVAPGLLARAISAGCRGTRPARARTAPCSAGARRAAPRRCAAPCGWPLLDLRRVQVDAADDEHVVAPAADPAHPHRDPAARAGAASSAVMSPVRYRISGIACSVIAVSTSSPGTPATRAPAAALPRRGRCGAASGGMRDARRPRTFEVGHTGYAIDTDRSRNGAGVAR